MSNIADVFGKHVNASVISKCPTIKSETAFIKDGKLIPAPTSEVSKISQEELSFFCLTHGLYSLPTTELIELIEMEIDDPSKAIEIGGGNGVYGRSLGIKSTDNYMQHPKNRGKFNNCLALYEAAGQMPVQYGDDVEELDAKEAIRKYKPEVVVCAWVTHKFNRTKPNLGGNMFGVDFKWILDRPHVKKIILVGNEHIHKNNPIMNLVHETYSSEYLFSRSQQPELDRVYIWRK